MTQVVVIAAGEGTRLYPFSQLIPKIMFPAGKDKFTVGEHIINHCKEHGLIKFVFCINKNSGKYIKNSYGDGSRFGVEIKYSESKTPLGTAGEIKNAYNQNFINEDFFVYYGDTLSDVDLMMLKKTAEQFKNVKVVITCHDCSIPYGFVESYFGVPEKIKEKPKISEMFPKYYGKTYGAILPIFYVKYRDTPVQMNIGDDFVSDYLRKLNNENIRVYHHCGKFLDMGTLKNYLISENWE